ncbi:MAG: PDZ domain-containing protein [Pirellulales bacterium]|nr:PDZ domain-containing protein [Pirellulales bacterium]
MLSCLSSCLSLAFSCRLRRDTGTCKFIVLLIAGLLLCGWPLCCTAQPTEPPKIVEDLIKQLDSNRFEVRQLAERRLAEMGMPALAAVGKSAASGSLESSTRALNIMLAWLEGSDPQLRMAALDEIAKLANRPKEAAIAATLLSDAREQVALQAIKDLGGYYGNDVQIRIAASVQVVIGKRWKGGLEGLKHLEDVHSVTTLSLHSAPLDERALVYLKNLPNVLRFEFYGTAISAGALQEFEAQVTAQRAAANLAAPIVVRRSGAWLGISGDVQTPNPGATVRGVHPEGAAANAGIRARDRITQIDGEDVADFKALTDRIAMYRPGDTVTLTVLRRQQSLPVKVTFQEWGTNLPIAPHNRSVPLPKQFRIERR